MAIVGEVVTFSEFADVDAMRRLAAFAGTMEDRDRSLLVSDASPIMQAGGDRARGSTLMSIRERRAH